MAPTVPIDFVGRKESKKGWFSKPMGKSRKYSKGHISGFVPDYRHAVETMGESEGFGSSGRVDTEMTASEDSYAPKRKCISLNMDDHDNFSIPMQLLPVSKMSILERKDLERRLKKELEQVRVLQMRAASISSSAVVHSPTSDIHSCSDGQKRPALENINRPFAVSAPPSKKHPAPGNGAHAKCSKPGHHESQKQGGSVGNSNALLMKRSETILDALMGHRFGWVFNTPVDVVNLNIPDYLTIIKHPMDLGTVKRKITCGDYLSPLGFAADVRLTFSNAMTYNPPGHEVHNMAATLSKVFEGRWKAIEKKLSVTIDVQPEPLGAAVPVNQEKSSVMPPSKKKKITHGVNKVKSEPVMQLMTVEEKQKLSTELESLLGELPGCIVDFLKEHSCNADQTNEDEIEIDIDALSDETLFKLRKLLDNYFVEKQNKQASAEPCEIELINDSGFSNSSQQLCRGNDPVDEDIDIVGGNEPPISSYPPLEVGKDAARKTGKCSSSSSSSDSGSSSSDSDSGSEANAVKSQVPINTTKLEDNEESGENLDEKRNGFGDSTLRNPCVNKLVSCETKPTAVEMDVHQEGESAPPERQVSPEKAFRAALLRNRFADTIFKAREKALEKGEKEDPEKFRMEKEELERRQKQEKARLQAEAKAAEEARRKAEAAAAAEARKKRELEREAARQALLQMEKTVEINENSQLLEDLEMLRTAQDEEQVPSFLEEMSPEKSQNGLGSFKLQGNPLEQLGLYMKEDDEEEEEVEAPPPSISEPAKDVEDGEID